MPSHKPAGRIVFILNRPSQCEGCDEEMGNGRFICLTDGKALCLECAELSDMEFLPSGDTAVTRRATKYSSEHVVVMKKSRARKRSERQGILAEPEAIARAVAQSEDDADRRAKTREKAAGTREKADRKYVAQFAESIARQYPGCPPKDCLAIATHACRKYSGRIGRSAAAKQFDAEAICLAVIAHIRHTRTNYETILAGCDDRLAARRQVRELVLDILDGWEQPTAD